MKLNRRKTILHLAFASLITAIAILCIAYPFLPGAYDSLAVALSTVVQVQSLLALLLVPVGGLWLAYEIGKGTDGASNPPRRARRYTFALVTVIVTAFVAIAGSLAAVMSSGLIGGLLTLALWLYLFSRVIPQLRSLKNVEDGNFNPVPLYLVIIPSVLLLFYLTFAAQLTEFSRNHAITQSAEFINDIEAYYAQHGEYPVSLLAVHKDYYPSVVGIEAFHYAPAGNAYNLFFEQPRFFFDNIGTREFVVYNKLDEQSMFSHTAWMLVLPPEDRESNQGWYAVHDTSIPHWKIFWFD
jgi:hypothetical protein